MKKIITLITLLLTLQVGFAQGHEAVFNKVTAAVKAGNSQVLSGYMNTSVEVTVPDADQAFSATQATQVLKKFFSDNPPQSVRVMHKGQSGANHYQTGEVTTAKGTYDMNIFIKEINGKFLITQIRFELE